MNKLIFLILTLSLPIALFGQKPTPSPKITNILDSYPNELYASLQGEHELRENAGWITFDNFNFKLAVTWKRKDKMLGMGTDHPGQDYYKTSATIKGQYSIEEYKIDKKRDYTENDKYGDPVKVIKRGFFYGYKIYFSGTDANGKYYNFFSDVYQEYQNGYMYNWVVSSVTGTNEIYLSFDITKYFKGDPAAYKKAEALRLELKRNEEIALKNEERKRKEAEELKLKIKLENENAFYSKFNCIIKSDRFKNLKYYSNIDVIGLPKFIRYLKNDTLFWFHENDSVSYEFKDIKLTPTSYTKEIVKIRGTWKCGINDSLIFTDDFENYLIEKDKNNKKSIQIKKDLENEKKQRLALLPQKIDLNKYSYKGYIIIISSVLNNDGRPNNMKYMSIFKNDIQVSESNDPFLLPYMEPSSIGYLEDLRTKIETELRKLNLNK